MRLAGTMFLLGLSLLTAAAFVIHYVLGITVSGVSCLVVAKVLARAGKTSEPERTVER